MIVFRRPGDLLVVASSLAHQDMEQVIGGLRAETDLQVSLEARFFQARPGFLQKAGVRPGAELAHKAMAALIRKVKASKDAMIVTAPAVTLQDGRSHSIVTAQSVGFMATAFVSADRRSVRAKGEFLWNLAIGANAVKAPGNQRPEDRGRPPRRTVTMSRGKPFDFRLPNRHSRVVKLGKERGRVLYVLITATVITEDLRYPRIPQH